MDNDSLIEKKHLIIAGVLVPLSAPASGAETLQRHVGTPFEVM